MGASFILNNTIRKIEEIFFFFAILQLGNKCDEKVSSEFEEVVLLTVAVLYDEAYGDG